MISVSVQVDIDKAVRFLRLLPEEADRAGYRAMNAVADDVLRWSAREIANETGLPLGSRKVAREGGGRDTVYGRMFVRGASRHRLMATVHALPSAKNVGYYTGADPRKVKAGVDLKAWRRRTTYDKAFVKNPDYRGKQRVWRRTGKGKDNISSRVFGPSVRKSFERPFVRAGQLAIIRTRWPIHFQRYLRAELVRLRGAEALRGVSNVLPGLTGPTLFVE